MGHFFAAEITGREKERMGVGFQERYDFNVIVLKLRVSRQDNPTASPHLSHPLGIVSVLFKMIRL